MADDDREAALKREHPGWDIWHGVGGRLVYGQLRRSSPPVTVKARNYTELGERIRAKEAALARRP